MSGADECDWEEINPFLGWILPQDQIGKFDEQWAKACRTGRGYAFLEYIPVFGAPPPQKI